MAAPLGNDYNRSLRTKEEKELAYKSYCDWLSQGNSKEAWVFDHPTVKICFKTMERYIREEPNDFPIIHKEMALANSLKVWEQRGLEMMMGQIEKCQPAIFQMFMRNKFGWDKDTQHKSDSNEPFLKKVASFVRGTSSEE